MKINKFRNLVHNFNDWEAVLFFILLLEFKSTDNIFNKDVCNGPTLLDFDFVS